EVPAVEILLRPVTTFEVRGRVYNLVAGRRSNTGVIVQLEQRNSNVAWGSPDHQSIVENPDGSFDIAGVLPGSYTLSALWFDEGRRYQARQSIEVGNANVETENFTFTRGLRVPERMVWDGRAGMDRDEFLLGLARRDSEFLSNGPAG